MFPSPSKLVKTGEKQVRVRPREIQFFLSFFFFKGLLNPTARLPLLGKVLRLRNEVRTSSPELIGTQVNKTNAELIIGSCCTILDDPLRASHALTDSTLIISLKSFNELFQ